MLLCLMMAGSLNVHAQKARNRRMGIKADSIIQVKDSLVIDSLKLLEERQKIENMEAPVDTAALVRKNDSIQKAMAAETKPRFIPNSNRAIWLALVIPGGGQIYNRKYWKLPIVYGGFVGCAYALTWNNRMYKDYSQAYLDIMDDDPNTKSYEDFLPHGVSAEGMENTFKNRKDFYRRYRDLSIFCVDAPLLCPWQAHNPTALTTHNTVARNTLFILFSSCLLYDLITFPVILLPVKPLHL